MVGETVALELLVQLLLLPEMWKKTFVDSDDDAYDGVDDVEAQVECMLWLLKA